MRNPQRKTLFSLSVSPQKLAEVEGALANVKRGVNRAIAGAINKTTAKGKTAVKRGLTQLLTIKSSNLNRRLYTKKASANKLEGAVLIMGRPIGLINFKHKDSRKKTGWGTTASGTGVRVQVYKSGETLHLPRAFVTKGQFGNVHIFQRKKFGGKIGTKAGRLPIETKYSQRLAEIYEDSPLKDEVNRSMAEDFERQIDSQISRLLAGR